MRVFALTILALIGFAANSLLCRRALGGGHIDAASFTLIRLGSGAVALAALVAAARVPAGTRWSGSWPGAIALFVYAAAFSFAYLKLDAGTGALILFGSVQATMLAWGLRRGERPRAIEWIGLAMAVGGLVALAAPGVTAPEPIGAALMACAGIAWGVYSLRGRGSAQPLAATADNFLRSLPFAIVLGGLALSSVRSDATGAMLAVISGAVTSGIAYAIWYAALRHLTAVRAAVVQLVVPVIAAAGGVAFLGETLTARLVLTGTVILGGIAISLVPTSPVRMPRP